MTELRPRWRAVGCVKSSIGKWLREMPLTEPEQSLCRALELVGLWTRTRAVRTELKVIYDAGTGVALGAFGSWSEGLRAPTLDWRRLIKPAVAG